MKNMPASAGDIRDASSIPGSRRSPGEGNGNPLQCSYLENPMDRGAWRVTVHGVAKSQTRLNDVHFASMSEASSFPNVLSQTGFPWWHSGKESACQCRRCKRLRFDPWVKKIPWRRKWQTTPVFLPGEFHGQKMLVDDSP